MKTTLLLFLVLTLAQPLLAGPFVAGGNGAMSLVYCNSNNGKFGATVNKDFSGNLFGYHWVSNTVSKVSTVKVTRATFPGSPKETPMIFSGKDFQIAIMMGNLPAQVGAPIDRGGKVRITTEKGTVERMVNCTLYGVK